MTTEWTRREISRKKCKKENKIQSRERGKKKRKRKTASEIAKTGRRKNINIVEKEILCWVDLIASSLDFLVSFPLFLWPNLVTGRRVAAH